MVHLVSHCGGPGLGMRDACGHSTRAEMGLVLDMVVQAKRLKH